MPLLSNNLVTEEALRLHPKPSAFRPVIAATALVGGLVVLCKGFAAVKEVLLAYWLGTGDALDAYLVAVALPASFTAIVSSCLASALIPQWLKLRQESPHESHRLYSGVLVIHLGFTVVLGAVLAAFRTPIVTLMASGFPAWKRHETAQALLLLVPVIALSGLSVIWASILAAARRFVAAQSAPLFTTAAIVLVALIAPRSGSAARTLAVATTAGAACEAALVGWALRRTGIRLLPAFRGVHQRTKTVFKEFSFLSVSNLSMAGVALINQFYASQLGSGSVAALSYANKIGLMLIAVATLAISTVLLPHFSALAARQDWEALRATSHWFITRSAAVLIPLTLLLTVGSLPIVRLCYQHGAFSAADSQLVSRVQICYFWQIPFVVPGLIANRVLMSLERSRCILFVGLLNLAAAALATAPLAGRFGVLGIGLSTLIMYIVATIATLVLAKSSLDGRVRGSTPVFDRLTGELANP
jgi:putative peptidoglycan lipid II flippase